MNVTEEQMKARHYDKHLDVNESVMQSIGGYSESLYCFDTYQFDDYSKVVADRFDVDKKAKRRKEIFPLDCEKAYDMGVRFARA